MAAVLLMVVGAAIIVGGIALVWVPLAVVTAGAFVFAAGFDLAGRPRRGATG
jgi:hypothetical protein